MSKEKLDTCVVLYERRKVKNLKPGDVYDAEPIWREIYGGADCPERVSAENEYFEVEHVSELGLSTECVIYGYPWNMRAPGDFEVKVIRHICTDDED